MVRFISLFVIFSLISLLACTPMPLQQSQDNITASQVSEQESEQVAEPVSVPEIQLLENKTGNQTSQELQAAENKPAQEIKTVADMITSSELEKTLSDISGEERAEPIVHRLLQKERGVYTIGNRRYTIYFESILDAKTAEMRIEGETKTVEIGESVRIDPKYTLDLVNIISGSSTSGDLVKFYYGTRDGMIADYIEEGETKIYIKNGQQYKITLLAVSNPPDMRAVFEINGKTVKQLDEKGQEIFEDRSFLFVASIFSNEASEISAQKAVEFTITEQ